MGNKRSRTRIHLYLCAACLMAMVLPACASVSAMLGTGEAFTHMRRAEPLMAQHDFEGALREYQEAAALSPAGPPGDEALFAMALVHAHYGNPKKDYRKSLALFSRVAKEYPGSPRAEEAKIWVGVLEAIERTKQVDAEIEERKKGLVK